MRRMMQVVCLVVIVAGLLFLEACGGGTSSTSDTSADFVIQVGDEQFVARLEGTQNIQTARQLLSGQLSDKIISGSLVRGSGTFNTNPKTGEPWSWHLDPVSVGFSDIAAEVCDALPSYVEDNLDEWIDVVKRYCPWRGEVVGELE
jgi:hypothetical protein